LNGKVLTMVCPQMCCHCNVDLHVFYRISGDTRSVDGAVAMALLVFVATMAMQQTSRTKIQQAVHETIIFGTIQ